MEEGVARMNARTVEAKEFLLGYLRRHVEPIAPDELADVLKARGFDSGNIEDAINWAISRNQLRVDRKMRFVRPRKSQKAAA
jgi:hypothetical protein